MDTQRQIRFGELIRSLLSDCLLKEDFFDENINSSSITISFVRMSRDLKIANVYFMPLGGRDKTQILEVLKDRKYIFQKFLSKAKINSKFTPKLSFYLDDTFDEAERIENLLNKILTNNSEYLNKKENLKKLNYQNSWINVNQKILKILNEN